MNVTSKSILEAIVLLVLAAQVVNGEWWYLNFLSGKISSLSPKPIQAKRPQTASLPEAMSLLSDRPLSSPPPSQPLDLESILRQKSAAASQDRARKGRLRRYCLNRSIFVSPLQRNLCKKNPNVVQIFARAAKLAVDECQHQLKFERWNCTVSKSRNVYGDVVKTKSRETAFIYALNAAASMYEITRACSRGELKNCACYVNEKDKEAAKLTPEACSDNVVYGRKLSRVFVDSIEYFDLTKIDALRLRARSKDFNEKTERRLMNLHNNEVGRKVVLHTLKRKCKCHGVSGSCSMRSCWVVMSEFREIGDELRRQYEAASKINKHKAVERVELLKSLVTRRSTRSTLEHGYNNELLYIRNSPDYCTGSSRIGLAGTRGRMCSSVESVGNATVSTGNFDSDGSFLESSPNDMCDYICCGRGFYSKLVETYEDCECKFQFCCTVTCKKCKKTTIQYFCN